MSKIDTTLFSAQEHALDKEYRLCPECGGTLVLRRSKHGLFLGCENYPSCQYMRPLQQQNVQIEKTLENSECPECGKPLAIKKGRFGLFIGCTAYPACSHIEANNPVVEEASTLPHCPACYLGQLQAKTSRYGKTFYACSNYPKCKYAVNDKPVSHPCPICGSAILVEKRTRQGVRFCCPQKGCTYSCESL
ncbi:DNA topoisomerase family protein [Tolumonas osonensis]|uniref:Putative DNA topoisomerase n=1 Tax=Tolumonas osonensis TaxID=675874 RepID=A0A841GT25_9GAMM|nr:topoisomerase DNA-binding C4 zinc finger domain-containing protein [Tolumonas osonensis]MBB6057043.1 putative DNA topoisomerase [Tolumonas osonensis]